MPSTAAETLSARYVMPTESGWRLPTLGEDVTYAVFYPSWYMSIGGGEARGDDIEDCDLVELSIGNHFSPQWMWALGGGQCENKTSGSDDKVTTYNLRIERLLADVESPLNMYLGLGVQGVSFDGTPPSDSAEDAAARANVGLQWRGKGRWALRVDHAQSAEGYKQTSLALLAYFGGSVDQNAAPPELLQGDSDTEDSKQYLSSAPPEPAEPVTTDTGATLTPAPVDSLAASDPDELLIVETSDSEVASAEADASAKAMDELTQLLDGDQAPTATAEVATPVAEVVTPEIEAPAAAEEIVVIAYDESHSGDGEPEAPTEEPAPAPTQPSAPVVTAEAGICPPLSRPLRDFAFNANGDLSAKSVESLRALAGTVARRDNTIARLALPAKAGAAQAADRAIAVMLRAEPQNEGRMVANVVDNLPVAVFELYALKAGC
ncbi:MAG: hypothetical protein AAF499_04325 [Pseudomonadota bacterium]